MPLATQIFHHVQLPKPLTVCTEVMRKFTLYNVITKRPDCIWKNNCSSSFSSYSEFACGRTLPVLCHHLAFSVCYMTGTVPVVLAGLSGIPELHDRGELKVLHTSIYFSVPRSRRSSMDCSQNGGDFKYGGNFLHGGTIKMRFKSKVIILFLPLVCKPSASMYVIHSWTEWS